MLHVQSISDWAPACIGPYAQAVASQGLLHMAGQIPLEPGSMQIERQGLSSQARTPSMLRGKPTHGQTLYAAAVLRVVAAVLSGAAMLPGPPRRQSRGGAACRWSGLHCSTTWHAGCQLPECTSKALPCMLMPSSIW